MSKRGGFILATILWLVVILLGALGYSLYLSKEQGKIAQGIYEKIETNRNVRNLYELLKFYFLSIEKIDYTSVSNKFFGFPEKLDLNGSRYSYGKCSFQCIDVSGLLNVFVPNERYFSSFVFSLEKDIDKSILEESLRDWIDRDNIALPFGAEDFYYKNLGMFRPRNSLAVQSIEEIRLIRGYRDISQWNKITQYLYFGKNVMKNVILLKGELLKSVLHLSETQFLYLEQLRKKRLFDEFIQRVRQMDSFVDDLMTFYPSLMVKIDIECKARTASTHLKSLVDFRNYDIVTYDYRVY